MGKLENSDLLKFTVSKILLPAKGRTKYFLEANK
jgi:hypothetical protein